MTDLTPFFASLLAARGVPIPTDRRPPPPHDEFLKEAYRIASHISTLLHSLSTTRLPYLSTSRAPVSRYSASSGTYLTDAQRDALDTQTKETIRRTLSLITRLESAEAVRARTARQVFEKKHNTFRALLLGGAEGEAAKATEEAALKAVEEHRDAVVWWLKHRLEEAGRLQTERQNVRLERERELGRSVLHRMNLPPPPPLREREREKARGREGGRAQEEEGEEEPPAELTQEQVQAFQQENAGMMQHYSDMLEQVRGAERSLVEMGELQNQIFATLSTQNSHLEALVQDAEQTQEDMRAGNQQLKSAAEKASVARAAFFTAVAFSATVVVWDWFV